MKELALVFAVIGLAWLAARMAPGAIAAPGDSTGATDDNSDAGSSWGFAPEETDQTNNVFEDAILTMNPTTYIPAGVPDDIAARNARAFLDMIASPQAEGTAGKGDNGYNVLFGGGLFSSYADHPRQYFTFTNSAGQVLRTSAAGRYQFIVPTWDALRSRLHLPDFSPDSQDQAALELIREKGALADVQAGRVAMAIDKVSTIWASLPGAGANQHEASFTYLLAQYRSAGGTTAEA